MTMDFQNTYHLINLVVLLAGWSKSGMQLNPFDFLSFEINFFLCYLTILQGSLNI